jgi:RNA polymerase sigma-70 factor (ECF subfamily)
VTVVARRIVIRQLNKCRPKSGLEHAIARRTEDGLNPPHERPDRSVEQREEVEFLFDQLSEKETSAVQMYYFDGRDYSAISRSLGIPENSVGPVLSRARNKMRRAVQHQRAGWSPTATSDFTSRWGHSQARRGQFHPV